MAGRERKEEKAKEKQIRKEAKKNKKDNQVDGVDPDLEGIVPGPQPIDYKY